LLFKDPNITLDALEVVWMKLHLKVPTKYVTKYEFWGLLGLKRNFKMGVWKYKH